MKAVLPSQRCAFVKSKEENSSHELIRIYTHTYTYAHIFVCMLPMDLVIYMRSIDRNGRHTILFLFNLVFYSTEIPTAG